jgi:hypothetical protein
MLCPRLQLWRHPSGHFVARFGGRDLPLTILMALLTAQPGPCPVNLSLHRDLAQRARIIGPDAPTNTVYVPLPTLASIKGTLGAPAPEVDKVKAGLLAARGIAGLVGGRTGDVIGGAADLLGNVNKGGTNAVGSLIQSLGGLLGAGKPQTQTATNPPPGAASQKAAPTDGKKSTPEAPPPKK